MAGFAHVVNLGSEDFTAKVKENTEGQGVDVVYDGTGESTFNRSVRLVKVGGTAVLYGWPSGIPVIDTDLLSQKQISLLQAVLNHYVMDKVKTNTAITEIFELVRRGIFELQDPTVYAVADAAAAHADLESRKTTGSVILRP
ncbi:zinc-binding dehydrogenase [Dyadobacter sp. OTU695]|uniref:zinc-binding dehydrogenase n=1 Tax=Dyadobacter sp. OTU695 TaxID=3043860 RepID=UPI00313EF436